MIASVIQPLPVVCRAKQANQSAFSTALVSDSDLWIPAQAGEVWSVEWWVQVQMVGTGPQLAVTAPSDVTMLAFGELFSVTEGATNQASSTTVTAPGVVVSTSNANFAFGRVTALVQMGQKNGPIGLQFSINSAGAGNSATLQAGCGMWATRK